MTVGEGFVRALAQPIWRIDDAGGNQLCRFDPQLFAGFVDGDPVYFTDESPHDGIAENVQPRLLVDRLANVATPRNGITNAGAMMLRAQIMQWLMGHDQALAVDQPSAMPNIEQSLATIASALNQTTSARATVPNLRELGF